MESKYSDTAFYRLGKSLLLFVLCFCLFPILQTTAQDAKMIKPRINLSVTQMSNDSIELEALLRAKFEEVYEKVGYTEIEFYHVGEEGESLLGKDETDVEGIARITVAAHRIPVNADGYLAFLARFDGDHELRPAETDANVLKARLDLTPVDQDSVLTIALSLMATTADGDSALVDADIDLFVKRMVGNLKVGEGTTDEQGNVEINFPTDLAGDDVGHIFITAYIEDFEEYGNLRATTVQPWGKPVSFAITDQPRALWSAAPPTWLLFIFLGLLGILWGHYAVIAYRLARLGKTG